MTEDIKTENSETNGTSAESNSSETRQEKGFQTTPEFNYEEELNKAKIEISSLKDSWARERAEFQNFKRRTASEYQTIRKEAVKNFIIKILTPLDNLERVIGAQNVAEEIKPFVDGVKMIRREFLSVLEKENVFEHSPNGEVFDPMNMEAIASDESEDYKDETVIEVYQTGFVVKENNESTTLRPARVKVGRPKL